MADAPTEGMEPTLAALEQTLNGGTLGVAAVFLNTGVSVFYKADTVFPTASVIKVAIVAELYTQVAEGRISAEGLHAPTVEIRDGDRVGGSGILAALQTPGLQFSLADLALLTIKISDNTASNLCLRAVGGPEVVNRRLRQWGLNDTTIHRPIKFALEPGDPPYTATGTPRDLCRLLTLLTRHELPARSISESVLALLATVSDADMLPRYLNVNFFSGDLKSGVPEFQVWHKPGAVTGVRNDLGVIRRGEEQLVVCVLTKNCPDTIWTPANQGSETVARVGKTLTDHFFPA